MTASERPKIVHLTYQLQDGSWWAESEDLPGLFAGGDSLDDAKQLARQVVREEIGDDVTIFDWMPAPAELEPIVASKGARAREAVHPTMTGPKDAVNPLGEWLLPPTHAEPTA
jgi:predicted RNase H-like HicB family nuclease